MSSKYYKRNSFSHQDEQKPQKISIEGTAPKPENKSELLLQLEEQRIRVDELKQKLTKLDKEKREEKDVYLKAAKNLEKELAKRTEECEKLQKDLENARKESLEKMSDMLSQKNDEIGNLKSEVYNTRFELNRKISELKDELKGLKEFKDRKEEYLKQVSYWKKRCNELIKTYDTKKVTEIGQEAVEKKEVLENREFESLMHGKRKNTDVSKVDQDMSFQEDVFVQNTTINFKREIKMKKLQEKVFALNNHITQETVSHGKELEKIRYQSQVRINELEKQLNNTTEELRLKTKEAKNLKALSQIILDQRSEIEEFLLEALDHVKEEIKKKILERKTKLPDFWGKGKVAGDKNTSKNNEKIDFSILDWEEKERILKILFSKMNSGLLPGNWRDLFQEKRADLVNRSFNIGRNRQEFSSREAQRSPIRGGI